MTKAITSLLSLMIWLMVLTTCLPTFESTSNPTDTPFIKLPTVTTTTKLSSLPNKRGVHLLLTDGFHDWPLTIWDNHLAQARQAVGAWGYVVQLVRLDDLEVARWQQFMDLCATYQLTPIVRLATTHNPTGGWLAPPRDEDGSYQTVANDYAEFVATLQWPTTPHYITVGNEPNHGTEWGGRPDPAAYARFLIDVAQAIHQADSQAFILNAGLDAYSPHTGNQPFIDGHYYIDSETFMDEMVSAYPTVFTHIDGWASHAYPQGPFTEPPWNQTYQIDWLNGVTNLHHIKPPAGIVNRGINGYEWELFKLSTYGIDELPVFITETGWRHAETVDATSPDNGRPLPSAEQVADYVALAMWGDHNRYPDAPKTGWQPWQNDSRVQAVVFFAFNGHPTIWGHTNWLILDEMGTVTGVYTPFIVLQEGVNIDN